MINLSKENSKGYIHLGLGVNEGIRRFKEKWGGVPFLKYDESIRVNSDFEALLESIRIFNEESKGVLQYAPTHRKPKLHIVYLMLRDNISEVPSLMNLAKDIGIEEVALTNLIHVANEWQEGQRVFTSPIPLPLGERARVRGTKKSSKRQKLRQRN
jgi:hypothetical protein